MIVKSILIIKSLTNRKIKKVMKALEGVVEVQVMLFPTLQEEKIDLVIQYTL